MRGGNKDKGEDENEGIEVLRKEGDDVFGEEKREKQYSETEGSSE